MTDLERDVERIRRGLGLLADEARDAPVEPAVRRGRTPKRRPVLVAGAAVLAVATGGGLAVALRGGGSGSEAATSNRTLAPPPAARPASTPTNGAKAPALSLVERVRSSDRIVVGTVTALTRGELEAAQGLPYVLATISVERSLKPGGASAGSVVAFDYDLAEGGSKVYSEASAPWRVGERVLLFLGSDSGTVSESLQPDHLQVVGGASGRYVFRGRRLEAPFSLADVEAEVARQG
jgi:hypothetical protein